jgi:hypothetical protein
MCIISAIKYVDHDGFSARTGRSNAIAPALTRHV